MIRSGGAAFASYPVELVEMMERFGAVVSEADTVTVVTGPDGSRRIDITARLPWGPGVDPPTIRTREVWRPTGMPMDPDAFELTEYAYELLHRPLGYRRSLHLHHADAFLRAYGRPEHEHCEVPIGHAACAHVAGEPVRGGFDGFRRLLDVFIQGGPPDCRALRCLG